MDSVLVNTGVAISPTHHGRIAMKQLHGITITLAGLCAMLLLSAWEL